MVIKIRCSTALQTISGFVISGTQPTERQSNEQNCRVQSLIWRIIIIIILQDHVPSLGPAWEVSVFDWHLAVRLGR